MRSAARHLKESNEVDAVVGRRQQYGLALLQRAGGETRSYAWDSRTWNRVIKLLDEAMNAEEDAAATVVSLGTRLSELRERVGQLERHI
jgi:hypothetical protein